MLKRYKEIFFGLLLGLAMWGADALMHTMMPMPGKDHRLTFTEELVFPDGPQLITRLLFLGFAFFLGWLLWRSNKREREVRELERKVATFYEQVIDPAMLILDECNTLLRGEGLAGESLKLVKEMRSQARQIDNFVKDFPRRTALSPAKEDE